MTKRIKLLSRDEVEKMSREEVMREFFATTITLIAYCAFIGGSLWVTLHFITKFW